MSLIWLIAVCFSFFSCSSSEIIYMSQGAANQTCRVNNSTLLSPCYSFQQLCDDKKDLLINKSAVALLLLPGRHIIHENLTLKLSHINEVEISPWNPEAQEVIECQTNNAFLFHNIEKLNIVSIIFTSCTVLINSTGLPFKGNIIISDCVFTRSDDFAIAVIKNYHTRKKFNISLTSCVFESNNGILSSNYGFWAIPYFNTVLLFIINSVIGDMIWKEIW